MAYFYKHIKGLNSSEGTHYITWSSVGSQEDPLDKESQTNLPTFSVTAKNANDTNATNNYGHFLVAGTQNNSEWTQHTYSNFLVHNRSFCFENFQKTAPTETDTEYSKLTDGLYTFINATHIQTPKISAPSSGGITGNYSTVNPSSVAINFKPEGGGIVFSTENSSAAIAIKPNGDISFNDNKATMSKGSIESSGSIKAQTNITSKEGNIIATKGYCEAVYFNAKSDKRAKTNIKPISISALDYINSIPVYSFNYKNNCKPSIGIMAQDVLDKPVGDLNFVENQEATGENNDFMSIKESKLVYVLWKAVQELSEEVKILKEQLNKKVL